MADQLNAETEYYPVSERPESQSLSISATTATPDEGRFVAGTLLGGRYRIVGLIGRGGMGEVYRATDLMLGQSVALKFLIAGGNHTLLERFQSEVRVARQISHPNVCRVHDIGEMEGLPFISMEFVDGEDLAGLITRIGRLSMDRAIEAAHEICLGLAAAHRKGIIHRDLKPQNIMMNRQGDIVIMDFGLAAIAKRLSGLEGRNGTPAYMSPEQLGGAEVTAKSDIYALGLVLYEVFTGRRPFLAENMTQLLQQQEAADYAPMVSIVPGLDPAIEETVRLCLNPDPTRRPENPLAVLSTLPGGEPLSAAVAARRTLSPEAVARAGKRGGLALRYSAPCLAAILLCLAAAPFLKQAKVAFYQAPAHYSPPVLRQKARDFASSVGYTRMPADTASQFSQRLEVIKYLQALPGQKRWPEWLAAESPILQLNWETPAPIVAMPAGFVFSRPPSQDPGALEVQLDGEARLRGFSAVPYMNSSVNAPFDPTIVFRAAGFDWSEFVPVTPSSSYRPPWADHINAWNGRHPRLTDTMVTVQIATWGNQLTSVQMTWPWMHLSTRATTLQAAMAHYQGLFTDLAMLTGFVIACLLARRNWDNGKSDRRGAFRVASARFLLSIAAWAGIAHFVPNQVYTYLRGGTSQALFSAGILFLVYIALEPALRTRWPHSLVSWNRLLNGAWDDGQVAAHILIGTALGALLWTAGQIRNVIAAPKEGLDTLSGFFLLNGTPQWVAGILNRAGTALESGLTIFFVVFLLRTILRKEWLAALAGSLLFAAMQPGLPYAFDWVTLFVTYLFVFAILIFALLRFGLVVAIFADFAENAFSGMNLGTDLTAWYTPNGFATAGLILLVALIAFKYSLVIAPAGTPTEMNSHYLLRTSQAASRGANSHRRGPTTFHP
jgi:serine/threonine-protein kinase